MNMFKGLGLNLRSEGVLGYQERKMQAIRVSGHGELGIMLATVESMKFP